MVLCARLTRPLDDFALVVQAHLQARATVQDPAYRYRVKPYSTIPMVAPGCGACMPQRVAMRRTHKGLE